MDQLQGLRKSIDLIDDSIIKLLAERLRIVKKVGRYKKERDIPPFDQKRWKKVLDSKMVKAKALGLDPELVRKIYNTIHKFALEQEKKA